MRRKKAESEAEPPDRDLLKHIGDLGLESLDAYRQWCSDNGFSKKLNKHLKHRCRERHYVQESIARKQLIRKKREKRSFTEVLFGICDGKLSEQQVTQPHLKRLCNAVRAASKHEPQVDQESLVRLLSHLHDIRAKIFDSSPAVAALGQVAGNTYLEAIVLVARHHRAWLRPAEQWRPQSHNARKQFGSLLRHLFVRHDDMPLFFDTVWFAGDTKDAAERRNWFLHVGQGKNVRHCVLPVPYTRIMAHHFMRAPADMTVDQALRWGQVCGFGGDQRLARALLGTRLAASFEHGEFWTTVIRWFVANPMLDVVHIGPIIDYLHHQRFVPENRAVAPGRRGETSPPQPNLSMKGRTPQSLLRRVNEWHRKLASDNTQQMCQWQPSGIQGFEFTEGSLEGRNFKCWTIRELLSTRSLVAEGRQMKHCVASYASSCARGRCSIWTVEVESFEGVTKALTLEIRSCGRTICQARGKANRLPSEKERNILRRWAATTGLQLANYI